MNYEARRITLEQSLLSAYGDWIAKYSGKGILTLEDKRTIPCAFEVGQLKNAGVLLLCGFFTPPAFSPFVSPNKFDGTTTEDYHVSTRGSLTIVDFNLDYRPSNQSESWAIYHLNEITVQMAESMPTDSIRFGLTNFMFDEHFTLRLQHQSNMMMLSIEPVEEHSRVMQRVRILKSIDTHCASG